MQEVGRYHEKSEEEASTNLVRIWGDPNIRVLNFTEFPSSPTHVEWRLQNCRVANFQRTALILLLQNLYYEMRKCLMKKGSLWKKQTIRRWTNQMKDFTVLIVFLFCQLKYVFNLTRNVFDAEYAWTERLIRICKNCLCTQWCRFLLV